MAKIYYSLVKKGLRTLETVPEEFREEVARMLQEGA